MATEADLMAIVLRRELIAIEGRIRDLQFRYETELALLKKLRADKVAEIGHTAA